MTHSHHTPSSPSWVKAIFLFAALFVATSQAACISLAKSKACPSYSKFYVDNSIQAALSQYGIIIASFNSVDDFDNAVFNATGFLTSTDCSGYNKTVHIPYQDTLLCTIAVQEDASRNNCAAQQPTTVSSNMCADSCKLYQDGLSAMIQKYCPKSTTALANLADLTTICSRKEPKSWMGLHDTSKTCVRAQDNEIATCGLGSLANKCTFCKAQLNNATATATDCCKDAATACNITTTPAPSSGTVTGGLPGPNATYLTPTATYTNTPSATPNQPDTASKTGLSSGAIGGIIGGSVAGVFLFAFAMFACVRRSKHADSYRNSGLSRQMSSTSGRSGHSARYNISSPKLQEEGMMTSATTIPMTTLPPMPEPTSLGLGSAFASAGSDAMAAGVGAGVGGAAVAAGTMAGSDGSGKPSYCQALYTYQASMADELDLSPGDLVNVLRVFDDGWAAGLNMNTAKEGVFPVVCVMFVDESTLDDDFEEVNMHSMAPMTTREEDRDGRNSPRSSLPSRSSSPVNLPRRNSSILRENGVIVGSGSGNSNGAAAAGAGTPAAGTSPMTSSPLAASNNNSASSVHRWWDASDRL
ncbi:hypothetical protein B0O80DRAFT_14204 [Mortierella sp. GBAus27b]|nr:hypothetical protein BGX31_001639 [Mortierella sp. GBA43]KAI8363469.1 hypothetical protein B0O80DRAFT_14204 [Mortierella sp. GBAus27b]